MCLSVCPSHFLSTRLQVRPPQRIFTVDSLTDTDLRKDVRPATETSAFHEILYTAADFELDERHVIKNKKVALDRLRVRQNVFLVLKVFDVVWVD